MGSGFVVAVMVGAGIAVQVAVLGRASGQLSPLAVSLALMVPGLLAATIWATVTRSWSDVAVVPGKWWWLVLGGGWCSVSAGGSSSPRSASLPTGSA
jgi:hypothetical protein